MYGIRSQVINVRIVTFRDTAKPRAVFIEFEDQVSLEKAVSLDGVVCAPCSYKQEAC